MEVELWAQHKRKTLKKKDKITKKKPSTSNFFFWLDRDRKSDWEWERDIEQLLIATKERKREKLLENGEMDIKKKKGEKMGFNWNGHDVRKNMTYIKYIVVLAIA